MISVGLGYDVGFRIVVDLLAQVLNHICRQLKSFV